VPGGGGRSGAAVAVLGVHGDAVLREGVPAEGLEGAQGRVQAGAEGSAAAAAAAAAEVGGSRSRGPATIYCWWNGRSRAGRGQTVLCVQVFQRQHWLTPVAGSHAVPLAEHKSVVHGGALQRP
jgi:hypothetical protein